MQGWVVPGGYMLQILFAIFTVKQDFHNWENNVNEIRAWLFIEGSFFFVWIYSSIFFVFVAYVTKMKSVSKRPEIMEMDDNVWNDNNTDDFLRYLKFEYFYLNYQFSFGITEFSYIFCFFGKMLIFGPRDEYPTCVMFIILFCIRMMHLIISWARITSGKGLVIQHWFDETSPSPTAFESLVNIMRTLIHFLGYGVVLWFYINTNHMEG